MYIQQYVPANKVTRHSKCYKNREMSKNKTIFGHVHVHANNTCKYYANGNIVYLRTEYRMPGCAAQKNWTPCFRSSRGRISYPASSDAAVFTSSLCCWSTEWGIWSAMESSSQLQVYVCLKII